ncbi:MAG TPA: ABC transporter substrate-binding protein [Xanthobacteraceae bacterium]|jgi:branched-chain amino acid transport system substrate-binding protein|nr:ABC transporter substrate-binding protein [Xanthobacteraceae bacterium]
MTKTGNPIYRPVKRRTVLRGMAAAGGFVATAPYIGTSYAAGEDINIGVLLPFTGSQGAYGPDMRKAAELTAKKINDAGGILGGRKFKLFFEDDESSPTAGLASTKKLLEIDKCVSVIGIWGSPIAMAIKPVLISANTCMMVSGAANAITEGDTKGLVWRYQAKASNWGSGMAQAMVERKYKTVSILAQQNAFVIAMVEPAKKVFEKAGVKVIDTVIYNPDQPSYRAEVQRIFGRNPAPDAVMCLGLLTDFVSIVRETARVDAKSKIMALSIMADAEGQFLKAVGPEAAEGIEHFQPAPPLSSPSYKKFQKLMGADENALFLFASNTHDQICTLAMAMEKAKSTDSVAFTKEIRAVCNPPGEPVNDVLDALTKIRAGTKINFDGAGSSCDFDSRGDQINRSYAVYKIIGGKQVLQNIIKEPEASL